jgi:hypothetical protein
MITAIDQAIASGALSINKYLDQHRHRTRDIIIQHPEAKVYEAVKHQANGGAAVYLDAEIDDHEAIAIPVFFDGDLAQIDW